MTEMRHGEVTLDPHNLEHSVDQLSEVYHLSPEDQNLVRRVIALYSQPIQMYVDEAITILHDSMPLGDRFTFDMDTDELILFSHDKEILIDALLEMAMYLAGFTTMMGSDETWVTEFTIGAWKPVKKRIKRQLGIPVSDQPRGVVGLPPSAEAAPVDEPYPFRRLVSHYDLASFHQMVMLAARDDIAVYFPPETHHKVLAVYVYMRRSMQEVAQGIDLADYETFNERLLEEIQRLNTLFSPASLSLPAWLHDRHQDDLPSSGDDLDSEPEPEHPSDPFEAFIEDLFTNDPDTDENLDS